MNGCFSYLYDILCRALLEHEMTMRMYSDRPTNRVYKLVHKCNSHDSSRTIRAERRTGCPNTNVIQHADFDLNTLLKTNVCFSFFTSPTDFMEADSSQSVPLNFSNSKRRT
ncbi:hypothetical protein QQG55_17730 [Brugia pahangi]